VWREETRRNLCESPIDRRALEVMGGRRGLGQTPSPRRPSRRPTTTQSARPSRPSHRHRGSNRPSVFRVRARPTAYPLMIRIRTRGPRARPHAAARPRGDATRAAPDSARSSRSICTIVCVSRELTVRSILWIESRDRRRTGLAARYTEVISKTSRSDGFSPRATSKSNALKSTREN